MVRVLVTILLSQEKSTKQAGTPANGVTNKWINKLGIQLLDRKMGCFFFSFTNINEKQGLVDALTASLKEGTVTAG